MTGDEIMFDRSLLGLEHVAGGFDISRETIVAFCEAVGETNALFTDRDTARAAGYDDIIAPPAFCSVFTPRVGLPDIKLEFGEVTLMAGQALQYVAPVRPGDRLEARAVLKEVYNKTGRSGMMVFWTWETRYANQDGVTVAIAEQSFVRRNRNTG
jgi:acyl dehydratase